MLKIIRDRDTGKTKELLKACAEDKGFFVCKHPERVELKCHNYGVPLVKTLDYLTYARTYSEFKNMNVYIDDLDEFMATVYNIKGFALNID